MENQRSETPRSEEEMAERIEDGPRNYAAYGHGEQVGFDPTKELNLPADYDEVMARFKRLQASREMESLN